MFVIDNSTSVLKTLWHQVIRVEFIWIALLLLMQQAFAEAIPKGFVYLDKIDSSIPQDIRYATANNFMATKVDGYLTGRCILTEQAANALKAVQAEVRKSGLSLKVYDCYRPQQAVDHFKKWAQDLSDQKAKAAYYPNVEKNTLFEKGYIAEKSGHSRGSTVDLTLVPMQKKNKKSAFQIPNNFQCLEKNSYQIGDESIEMGTAFDCFDEKAHTDTSGISQLEYLDRQLLRTAMKHHGFRNLPEEWWHYTLIDEPYPDTYFNFPVQ